MLAAEDRAERAEAERKRHALAAQLDAAMRDAQARRALNRTEEDARDLAWLAQTFRDVAQEERERRDRTRTLAAEAQRYRAYAREMREHERCEELEADR